MQWHHNNSYEYAIRFCSHPHDNEVKKNTGPASPQTSRDEMTVHKLTVIPDGMLTKKYPIRYRDMAEVQIKYYLAVMLS